MRSLVTASTLAALGLGLSSACSSSAPQSSSTSPEPSVQAAESPAELLFVGGVIRTMTTDGAVAEALAVRGGEIVYVGSAEGAQAFRGDSTELVDLGGKLLMPGFIDGHVHPVTGGIWANGCDLLEVETLEVLKSTIRECAAKNDSEWLVGRGWALPLFKDANPSRQLLDELVGDKPAYLTGADGHSAWVNSAALARAGVTAKTTDPKDGRIERDAKGKPSGTLREGAMDLVWKHVPERTAEDYQDGLRRGMAIAHGFGITSLIDAGASPEVLAAYEALDRAGELTLRVVTAQTTDLDVGPEQLEAIVQRAKDAASQRLRADMIKIFVDGVIEAKTAAMLEPYTGTKVSGTANIEPKALEALVVAADAAKLDVHFHAIGDRAVRMSLDAVEAARDKNPDHWGRPSLSHIQVIQPEDIPRFAKLGAIAAFQPLWAYADTYITDLTIPFLGPERSRWLYPIGSVVATGAVVAGGSDWTVSSMNPLDAIEVGVTRQAPSAAKPAPPLYPEERVAVGVMLAAYTRGAAFAARRENEVGTLEVGKRADLIVLDRDVATIPAADINAAKVLTTYVDGRVVYRAETASSAAP